MKLSVKLLMPLLLFWVCLATQAQQGSFRFEAGGQGGWLLPHSPELKPLTANTPVMFNAQVGYTFYGSGAYAQCNCLPTLGAGLHHTNFNYPNVLGHSNTLYVFGQALLFKNRWATLSGQTTFGLSYLTQPYHHATNPQNTFYSLPVSFLMGISLSAFALPTNKLRPGFLLSYYHISNGGIRQPNKGMNYPMLGVGLRYHWQTPHYPTHAPARIDTLPHWGWWLHTALAVRNQDVTAEQQNVLNYVASVWGGGSYRLGRFSALMVGTEFTYDQQLQRLAQMPTNDANYLLLAALAGHQFRLGYVRFAQLLGVYAIKPNHISQSVYQRYLLGFKLWPRVEAGISIKAHLNTADAIQIYAGVGF